jgi:4-hydroxythreonine-4-phosphate dehydrogenase
MNKPLIGISIGDVNGIGPELIIQTFADNRLLDFFTPIVFGNSKVFHEYRKVHPESHIQFNVITDFSKINPKQVNLFTAWTNELEVHPGKETKEAGAAAVAALEASTKALQEGKIHGLVTMPINKNNTQSSSFQYTGHTPFFKAKFNAKDVLMFLVTDTLKVALLTEHVPVADIAKHVTKENIIAKLNLVNDSLKKDFGVTKPRIAVLGLNPHAGDGGTIGKEEKEIILPAIQEANSKGITAVGPFAADGFFARHHDANFDAVLAMYHDQGLIPFKSFDRAQGVNYTAGLPVVRTSPDHGTAYDIAGKGQASSSSFLEAIFTCIDILNSRSEYKFYTANPLRRGSGAHAIKKSKSREDVEN